MTDRIGDLAAPEVDWSRYNQPFGTLADPNPVAYRTASPLVEIRPSDISAATNAALSASGGGLSTKIVKGSAKLGDILNPEGQPLGIKVYHSSPYDFEKFDLSKIGTGEGAQVYGHGLYFAESPKVSGQGGQYWQQFLHHPSISPAERDLAAELKYKNFDRNAVIDRYDREITELNRRAEMWADKPHMTSARLSVQRQAGELQAVRDRFASGEKIGPRTYEVNINADPVRFLDWDKPLNRQSPEVIEGLQRAMRPSQWQEFNPAMAGDAMNRGFIGLDKQIASEKLRDVGLPGIRYLDAGSRSAGAGSSNYVVFDPSIIQIIKKYGIAGAPVAGAMGSLAAQDSYGDKGF